MQPFGTGIASVRSSTPVAPVVILPGRAVTTGGRMDSAVRVFQPCQGIAHCHREAGAR